MESVNRGAAALVFCALLLCWLQEGAASLRARCVQGHCWFQSLENFDDAKTECENQMGTLLVSKCEESALMTSLLSGVNGRFWLRNADPGEASRCSAVSVRKGQNATCVSEPCQDRLDGFLCQFAPGDTCGVLQTDAQVTYNTSQGFTVEDSLSLPHGTIATLKRDGTDFPDSKHLCISKQWIPAPWNCEVFGGGCELGCNSTSTACTCPANHTIHSNRISCIPHPCAACTQGCERQGDRYVCTCEKGFRLELDDKSCVDINECQEEPSLCANEGEECQNTLGSYKCGCMIGLEEEDGVCVNVSICMLCEHLQCEKVNWVYQCACREGFRVSPTDPTMCEKHCSTRDCEAECIPNTGQEATSAEQCYCPEGYITDTRNGTVVCTDINECEQEKMCDHHCENLFGGYRCSCNDGFELQDHGSCVPLDVTYTELGSGSDFPPLATSDTPSSLQPASLPSYIKAGSVLGISVFLVLCVVLLGCLARNMMKQCRTFNIYSFKHPDIDIFYLQQVTAETYKRLSFDKQPRNDP
ncbi:thrombomodulin [Oryzias melastigma]|uniref:thrombomodulin n=1 Tax=Oryzias melastigma TaxID=30732 RepID=UPI00168D84D1|nr:thrombomodulin [Oryzias melastigma]